MQSPWLWIQTSARNLFHSLTTRLHAQPGVSDERTSISSNINEPTREHYQPLRSDSYSFDSDSETLVDDSKSPDSGNNSDNDDDEDDNDYPNAGSIDTSFVRDSLQLTRIRMRASSEDLSGRTRCRCGRWV